MQRKLEDSSGELPTIGVLKLETSFERFVGDIGPKVCAAKANLADSFVSALLGEGKCFPKSRYAKHSAAVTYYSAILQLGPGVEDLDVRHLRDFVETGNWLAGFVLAGITAARHDDADRRPRIPDHFGIFNLCESFVDRRFKNIQ